MTTTAAESMIREHLQRRAEALRVAWSDELDLFENRVIDSLEFMNFLMLLEEATGVPVDTERVQIEQLRTLATIRSHFFQPSLEAR